MAERIYVEHPGLEHGFIGVAGHADDDECTFREDGTDATYCGLPAWRHGEWGEYVTRQESGGSDRA